MTFQELFHNDIDKLSKYLDNVIGVQLKIDWPLYLVIYNKETDKFDFGVMDGCEFKLVDEFYPLLSNAFNKLVKHVNDNKESFKKHDGYFINCSGDGIILNNLCCSSDKLNSIKELRSIAKELQIGSPLIIWENKLTQTQKDWLISLAINNKNLNRDELKGLVKSYFGSYTHIPFEFDKLLDNWFNGIEITFKTEDNLLMSLDILHDSVVISNGIKDNYKLMGYMEQIHRTFVNYIVEFGQKYSSDKQENIEIHFLNMMRNTEIFNKLMFYGSKLTNIDRTLYGLDVNKIKSEKLKSNIKKFGYVYQCLFEAFLILFYYKKENNIYNNDFAQEVNWCVDIMSENFNYEDEIEEDIINEDIEGENTSNSPYCPKTPTEFIDWLNKTFVKDSSKRKIIDSVLSEKDIKTLYNESSKRGIGKQKLPIVVNWHNKKCFVCRRWTLGIQKQLSFNLDNNIRGIYCRLHNTNYDDEGNVLDRAAQGLAQEQQDLFDLKSFCIAISDCNSDEDLIKNVLNNPQYSRFIELYNTGCLSDAIEESSKKMPNEDWKSIYLSGFTNTRRNSNHEILANNYTFSEKTIEDVLEKSGSKIADITIKSNSSFTYISCKLKQSQLSGVSFKTIMSGNEVFKNGINNNLDFEDINKNSTYMKYLENFWRNFGVSSKDIYNRYRYLAHKDDANIETELNPEEIYIDINQKDLEKNISTFIVKVIGGNYWYLKPDFMCFIPDTLNNYVKFIFENNSIPIVHISKTGKTIIIRGKICTSNIKTECKIIFRTKGGNGHLPYDCSVQITDINDLLKSIKV